MAGESGREIRSCVPKNVSRKRKPCLDGTPTSRSVHADLTVDLEKRSRLLKNLGRMQLEELAFLPWDVDAPSLLQDLLLKNPVVLSRVRANTKGWTQEVIANTYKVPSDGSGMCSATDELRSYVEDFFEQGRVRKNGWRLEQCLDAVDLRPIFAFLTPILKPDAQTRITLSLAITVIASFHGKKAINWAAILREVVLTEADKLRKCDYTHITSYISHIYHAHGCLTETEQLQLCKLFPHPYASRPDNRKRLHTKIRPKFPLPPPNPFSIDNDPDSKLLVEITDFLVCGRTELVNEVERLQSTDSRQSPLHYSFTPPHEFVPEFCRANSPVIVSTSKDLISSSPAQPDDTYSPTSPARILHSLNEATSPSNSGRGCVNDIKIFVPKEIDFQYDAVSQALDVQVRGCGICQALHSTETQAQDLESVKRELQNLQEQNDILDDLAKRQAEEIEFRESSNAGLECQLRSLEKEHSDSVVEVQQLKNERDTSSDSRKKSAADSQKENKGLRRQLHESTGEHEGCLEELKRLENEVKSLTAAKATSDLDLESLQREIDERRAEVEQLTKQRTKSLERESNASLPEAQSSAHSAHTRPTNTDQNAGKPPTNRGRGRGRGRGRTGGQGGGDQLKLRAADEDWLHRLPRNDARDIDGVRVEEHYDCGLRKVEINKDMISKFMSTVEETTDKKHETFGLLMGLEVDGHFVINRLLIPTQTGGKEFCALDDCMAMAMYQIGTPELLQLGWIHTHPNQAAFFSSIDLHTQFRIQEHKHAVGIVVSTKYDRESPDIQVFQLLPAGVDYLKSCEDRSSDHHEHTNMPIYDVCRHVEFTKIGYEVIDFRESQQEQLEQSHDGEE